MRTQYLTYILAKDGESILRHDFLYIPSRSCEDHKSLHSCVLWGGAQARHAQCLIASKSSMQTGSWDDISGETFLRGLLSRGIEIAQYSVVSSYTTLQPLLSWHRQQHPF